MFRKLICLAFIGFALGCSSPKRVVIPEGGCKSPSEIPGLLKAVEEEEVASYGSYLFITTLGYSQGLRDTCDCLTKIGGPEAVTAFSTLLQSWKGHSRTRSLIALYLRTMHRPESIPIFASLLEEVHSEYGDEPDQHWLREEAIRALVEFNHPSIVPIFQKALRNPDRTVCLAGAHGLVQLEDIGSIPLLIEFVGTHVECNSAYLCADGFHESLRFLGRQKAVAAIPVLTQLVRNDKGVLQKKMDDWGMYQPSPDKDGCDVVYYDMYNAVHALNVIDKAEAISVLVRVRESSDRCKQIQASGLLDWILASQGPGP
jgi:HEAT repeat protein